MSGVRGPGTEVQTSREQTAGEYPPSVVVGFPEIRLIDTGVSFRSPFLSLIRSSGFVLKTLPESVEHQKDYRLSFRRRSVGSLVEPDGRQTFLLTLIFRDL